MNKQLFRISINWIKISIAHDMPEKRKGFIRLLAFSINGYGNKKELVEFVESLNKEKQDVKTVINILKESE